MVADKALNYDGDKGFNKNSLRSMHRAVKMLKCILAVSKIAMYILPVYNIYVRRFNAHTFILVQVRAYAFCFVS